MRNRFKLFTQSEKEDFETVSIYTVSQMTILFINDLNSICTKYKRDKNTVIAKGD